MFEECTMDIITHLPVTERGCDAIATFMDCMSKYVYFMYYKSTISAEELAQLFIVTMESRHEMPERIISDHNGRYLSGFW